MKKILIASVLFFTTQTAFAGDAATIVLKSGAIIRAKNGYSQLVRGMKELNKKNAENYGVEVKIEGSTFYLNLGDVALLCRDKCSSLDIEFPKKSSGR